MGWLPKGRELEQEYFTVKMAEARLQAEKAQLEQRLEDRDKQIEELSKQISLLQEALIAKESPDLYNDRKIAELEQNIPEEVAEARKVRSEQAQIMKTAMESIEQPGFESPDDLDKFLETVDAPNFGEMFTRLRMEATEPQAIHNNKES